MGLKVWELCLKPLTFFWRVRCNLSVLKIFLLLITEGGGRLLGRKLKLRKCGRQNGPSKISHPNSQNLSVCLGIPAMILLRSMVQLTLRCENYLAGPGPISWVLDNSVLSLKQKGNLEKRWKYRRLNISLLLWNGGGRIQRIWNKGYESLEELKAIQANSEGKNSYFRPITPRNWILSKTWKLSEVDFFQSLLIRTQLVNTLILTLL